MTEPQAEQQLLWGMETLASYYTGEFGEWLNATPKTPELITNLCQFMRAQIGGGRLCGDERLATAVEAIARHAETLQSEKNIALIEFCCDSIVKHGGHILRMLRAGQVHGLGQAYTTEALLDIAATAKLLRAAADYASEVADV